MNKNLVATRTHNEHKDVLLNKKCLRHLMNRIESKIHKIGIYEIDKIHSSCFDNETYWILNNGYDWFVLGYKS